MSNGPTIATAYIFMTTFTVAYSWLLVDIKGKPYFCLPMMASLIYQNYFFAISFFFILLVYFDTIMELLAMIVHRYNEICDFHSGIMVKKYCG